MASVFMSYSHADEAMRDRLETHLAMLKRDGVIEAWHDRRIVPGASLDGSIMAAVETAEVFLFLLSADFLASRYCYEVEMGRALARHEAGEVTILPIVLHACEWQHSPLGKLLAVPRDGKPIAQFSYVEEAYLEVAKAIRTAIAARQPSTPAAAPRASISPRAPAAAGIAAQPAPTRSSNLALRKVLTDADRHRFLEEGFEFMAKFFEESLAELERRNPGVEGRFRRHGADAFSARAFRGGKQEAQCSIRLGGGIMGGNGIAFSDDATGQPNSFSEFLSLKADDQGLMFDATGMSVMSGAKPNGLTHQGAAEFLWALFIRPMQTQWR